LRYFTYDAPQKLKPDRKKLEKNEEQSDPSKNEKEVKNEH